MTGFRIATIVLIILFLLGLQLDLNAKKTMTIFVVDLSASTGYEEDEIEAFVSDSLRDQGEDDLVGIVTFGRDASVQSSPKEVIVFNGFETVVNEHFTNISGALIYADALLEAGYKKRVVLITDGYENMGQSEQYLKSIPDKEMSFLIKSVEIQNFPEVQVTEVNLPKEVSENQQMDVTVSIYSNVETTALLQVYADDTVTFSTDIDLKVGMNQYVYGDQVDLKGMVSYHVEIVPEIDTFRDNNALGAFTKVTDKPYIMMVVDDPLKGDYLSNILGDVVYVDKVHTDNLAQNMENLIQYDGFVMVDVSAENLSSDFMNSLKDLVQYQGKGLLVTGGDNSYGPGGYFDTPIETILPVEMTIEPKEETPNLGLVLVIDKSGSMTGGQYGVSKLELAKEAAIRGTDVLEENDYLGVIAFDDTTKWVVEMEKAEDKADLQDAIATIVPGGGTAILGPLANAVEALKETDTKLKHIILLTDGQAERNGYDPILQDMENSDITISTVAVGRGSDIELLERLADEGEGRFYLTDEFSNIPTIFAKEAFIAGEKYLNHVTFTPEYQDYSEILSGINAVPALNGFVSTKIKTTSKLILKTLDDDPVLASWQYGLGRTVAWTSDVDGLWSTDWLNHPSGNQMFRNIFGWMIQSDINRSFDVVTNYEDGLAFVRIEGESLSDYTEASINGTILTPEGEVRDIVLEAIKPGVYQGDFEPEGEGVYLFDGVITVDGQDSVLSNGIMVGYSPEYDFSISYPLTAEKIALLSGGQVITEPGQVFSSSVPSIKGIYDLSRLCLWLALFTFLMELVMRKTNLINKTASVVHEARDKSQAKQSKKAADKQVKQSDEHKSASDLLERKKNRQL